MKKKIFCLTLIFYYYLNASSLSYVIDEIIELERKHILNGGLAKANLRCFPTSILNIDTEDVIKNIPNDELGKISIYININPDYMLVGNERFDFLENSRELDIDFNVYKSTKTQDKFKLSIESKKQGSTYRYFALAENENSHSLSILLCEKDNTYEFDINQ